MEKVNVALWVADEWRINPYTHLSLLDLLIFVCVFSFFVITYPFLQRYLLVKVFVWVTRLSIMKVQSFLSKRWTDTVTDFD